ncbi:MAG: nitroreductase family protein [Methanomassiliicoccales archaeon]
MNTLEAISTRRSCRSFSNRPIPPEIIDKLVRAAMQAPSAGNQQPWHFLIVTERKMLDAIVDVNPNAKMCLEAQAAILVCGDTSKERYPGFWPQDCSAAAQNLLLAAHEMGLGAVWTGVYPIEERIKGVRKLFKLPDEIVPLCLIPLGYPAKPLPQVDRFRPERVHMNGW